MELRGTGFTLRGWLPDDAVSLQLHADNTHISDFLLDRFPSPYTLTDAENWIKLTQHQEPFINFAIDVEGKAVGVIGIEMREDVYRKTALLGYWIGETYWGRGIMPQAVQLITAHAFNHLGLSRVQAGVLSNNPKSMRVLDKAGFTKEGVLKSSIIKNGILLDEHVYAMIKE